MKRKTFEDKVDEYVKGKLDSKEIESLWEEVVQNEDKLEYLKTTANVKGILEEDADRSRFYTRRKFTVYAAAAAIALLIGIIGFFNWNGETTRAVTPKESFELEYYRSADGDVSAETSQYNKLIDRAIRIANQGDTKEAINILEDKLRNSEDPTEIAFLSLNIGTLYYNDENYDNAIQYFKNVVDKENYIEMLTLEKGYWFLGNAYFQQGRLLKARDAIEKAYELNGAYRRVAHTYLNALPESEK